MRLAVIIGGLLAQRFPAVSGVALQYQRFVGVETQGVTEIGAGRVEIERRDVFRVHRIEPAHFPGVDPGAERACLNAGLADPAARKRFGVAVRVGAGDGGMAEPDLLVGPAFALSACCDRLTKQRPLRAIGGTVCVSEVGRHIPPLDAELRMRAMIGWKRKCLAGNHGSKPLRAFAETGEALRE